jgi:hypothetical protein
MLKKGNCAELLQYRTFRLTSHLPPACYHEHTHPFTYSPFHPHTPHTCIFRHDCGVYVCCMANAACKWQAEGERCEDEEVKLSKWLRYEVGRWRYDMQGLIDTLCIRYQGRGGGTACMASLVHCPWSEWAWEITSGTHGIARHTQHGTARHTRH